ncbi:MAG: hypothetical protein Q4C01_04030 [Clostridia bacterium]|nr:hypothetical protein [Clostridia bacterium]
MTLSTSAYKRRRAKALKIAMIYLGVALFCLMFYLVYNTFAHGVSSPFMSLLFLWPLILGFLPYTLLCIFPAVRAPRRIGSNLYHAGLASLIVSSCLRGVFEIAGTTSIYQALLMAVGAVLCICGVVAWLFEK